MSILPISNQNSFRVLFDKYIYLKTAFIFYTWKWPAEGTSTVPVVTAQFGSQDGQCAQVAWVCRVYLVQQCAEWW